MVPRQATFHIALLIKLLVVGLTFLLRKKLDGFSVRLSGLIEVFVSLMTVADSQVATEGVVI